MIKNTKENAERIAEEGRITRLSKTNPLQLKLRESIQKNDYLKINKYSEGMCYGEMKRDQVLSTLIYVCSRCIEKRGTEGILAKPTTKLTEELCDFCGHWEGGKNGNFVHQINCSLCKTCQDRIHSLHTRYQKGGGREKQHPYFQYLAKKHGNEWKDIMFDGITKRKF